MSYTKRTCVESGIRRSQPEMIQREIMVKTGNSKTGVSAMTFTGFLLGHKKSRRSVGSWFFNAGQRSYNRKRKVWICPDCDFGSSARVPFVVKLVSSVVSISFTALILWFVYLAITQSSYLFLLINK